MSRLLTITEVADRARVPVSTLRYWRLTGRNGPPSGQVGRRVVYRETEVDAWIDRQFSAQMGQRG